MSDLLSIGRSGVLAYQGALAAVGENVTNSDTEGFARRSVKLTEQTSATSPYSLNRTSSAFGGVQASQVQRVWDQYKATSAWSANSDASRSGTRTQYLSSVETMLSDTNGGVAAKLTAVFTSATQLAANPNDTSLRQTMLSNIGNAATGIGQTGADLGKIAGTVSSQAGSLVDQANSDLAALGKVNVALQTAPLGSAARAQLEDQRDSLIGGLSAKLGIDVTVEANGAASIKLSDYSGPLLLSSNSASPAFLRLQVATNGQVSMSVTKDGATSAATPTGGALAGLVDVSNVIAGRRQQVDAIASQLVTGLNAWQAQGKTPAGTAGVALLSGTDAATIALATNDPTAIAAASAAGADNGNLLALSSLRDGTGVEAKWQSLVNSHALLVSAATTESTAAASRKDGAYASLDEVSGVDLDTEAAELLRFQQAYQASAKVIQTARETLQSIFALFN
ncbi:flagellar hook-associated protein FlgK [Sphingomonas bacterium]|uniref:flagellar hook-associated protein FlgK n=1 Tax=Sphingomonas bacterium TaxID=1895847 RepID=UPI0015767E0B|nr:flagellar hook-associated protein FlgK [Sphingomonas bacterium]